MNKQYTLPKSNSTLKNKLLQRYESMEALMKKCIKDLTMRPSITLDLWTDDSLNMDICEMEQDHTAESILSTTEELLSKFDLSLDGIFQIVTDNGSNVVAAFKDIQTIDFNTEYVDDEDEDEEDELRNMSNIPDESILLDAFPQRLSCFAHSLQLVILKFFKDDVIYFSGYKKMMVVVRKVKISPKLKKELHERSGTTVILPSTTRWGSVIEVIKKFLEVKHGGSLRVGRQLSLSNINSLEGDEDAFTLAFANSFLYWFEPADHDFLRTYLCCIFVVSTADEDPMEELNRLQYQQHLQQHGGNDASTSLSLAHCSKPKWMLPNILKHYVLIEDGSVENTDRTKQIFASMVSKFGLPLCHQLRINSANCSEMPDPWARLMEQRYRGLQSGLELARRNLLAKSQALSEASQESDYSSLSSQFGAPTITRSSTGSSSLTGNTAGSPARHTSTTGVLGGALQRKPRCHWAFRKSEYCKRPVLGRSAICRKAVGCSKRDSSNRRTIGKSFTNVRKWLSAASSNAVPTSNSSIVYGPESSESQTRCLADMAFQFGLYNFALQLYQSLKKTLQMTRLGCTTLVHWKWQPLLASCPPTRRLYNLIMDNWHQESWPICRGIILKDT
uniref:Transposase n=1 Tax=Ditylenchus dipsaci TaxID=166011 RepID=A0A915DYI6_9BILA